jgi:hypothetical protein
MTFDHSIEFFIFYFKASIVIYISYLNISCGYKNIEYRDISLIKIIIYIIYVTLSVYAN